MKRPVRIMAAGYGLLLLLLLSGCTTVGRTPPMVDYRLELDPAAVPRAIQQGGILRVARPQAEAGANTRGIAYRTEPHQLRYYTKSRWADTPARMLGTVLTDALDSSKLFDGVVDDNRLPADYLLTSQLRRLEHRVVPDGAGSVELQLRLQLITLPERRLLGTWLIDTQAPAVENNAAAAVTAANAALAKATTTAIRRIAEALEEHTPTVSAP